MRKDVGMKQIACMVADCCWMAAVVLISALVTLVVGA